LPLLNFPTTGTSLLVTAVFFRFIEPFSSTLNPCILRVLYLLVLSAADTTSSSVLPFYQRGAIGTSVMLLVFFFLMNFLSSICRIHTVSLRTRVPLTCEFRPARSPLPRRPSAKAPQPNSLPSDFYAFDFPDVIFVLSLFPLPLFREHLESRPPIRRRVTFT